VQPQNRQGSIVFSKVGLLRLCYTAPETPRTPPTPAISNTGGAVEPRLDVSAANNLADRLEVDLVFIRQLSNTTVIIIIFFDSNFANATFSVSDSIVSDPDSRLRSKGYV
jgi:hypothetical protein